VVVLALALQGLHGGIPGGLLHWYTLVASECAGLVMAARGALFLAWKMDGTARTLTGVRTRST
jgi:hypothetical protein